MEHVLALATMVGDSSMPPQSPPRPPATRGYWDINAGVFTAGEPPKKAGSGITERYIINEETFDEVSAIAPEEEAPVVQGCSC